MVIKVCKAVRNDDDNNDNDDDDYVDDEHGKKITITQ